MKRQRFSLDKGWRFSKGDFTILPKDLSHNSVYGFAKAGGASGVAAQNYADQDWEEINLPHDWQVSEDFDKEASPNHNYKKGGIGWYRIKFNLDEQDKKRKISLEFDGISGVSTIYVNGSKLKYNESGYNSFNVDISDMASYGNNPNIIAIGVDRTQWEGWWYEGAGIYRHAWLIKSPMVSVDYNGIWIKTKRVEEKFKVELEVIVSNEYSIKKNSTVESRILDQSGKCIGKAMSKQIINGYEKQSVYLLFKDVEPVLWDLVNPYLYTMETSVISDDDCDVVCTEFGFRTIEVSPNKGFFLNGKNIKLKGTCNHQDHAGVGVAVPDTVQEYRLKILKEMGCNAYRCAHNNPSPELLNICDHLGILVMDENRNFNTSETGIRLLQDMVKRDRNHPCVVMYSVFNEEPLQGSPKGKKLALRLMNEIKKLDDTRPVLGSMNGGFMEEEGAAPIFDITGINYFTDSYDAFHVKFPNQPIVSSELVSAFSTRDNYKNDKEEQTYDNYDHNIAQWGETVRDANRDIFSRDYVMGMFVWTGFDYKGEPSPYEWPSVSSHFGTIDTCGFPKDSYYLYKALWKDEPALHLLPHWNWKKDEIVKVMAYTNCDEVELYLNNRLISKKSCDLYTQVEWKVTFEEGCIEAIGYKNGIKIISDRRETAGKSYELKLETNKECIFRDNKDALILNVSVVDEKGIIVILEESMIKFNIEGGTLLGVGNGNPNSHEKDKADYRLLFHGRCQGIIQGDGNDIIKITVESQTLGKVLLEVPVIDRITESIIKPINTVVVTDWRMSHIAQEEKQNPLLNLSGTDMNTLEPINFNGTTQSQFDNNKGKYCIYRTIFDFGAQKLNRILGFSKVAGDIEVYIKGNLIGKDLLSMSGNIQVKIPENIQGEDVITVIICNTSLDGKSGIIDPVEFIK